MGQYFFYSFFFDEMRFQGRDLAPIVPTWVRLCFPDLHLESRLAYTEIFLL